MTSEGIADPQTHQDTNGASSTPAAVPAVVVPAVDLDDFDDWGLLSVSDADVDGVASTAPPPLAAPQPADALHVSIGDTLIHRSPVAVTAPLRYLLAGTEIPRLLAVTSSIPGEGVTTISRTLAEMIAHDWRASTCWVDLNWWTSGSRPNEKALFPNTLADAVEGHVATATLPVATSIPNLSMVAAGELPVSTRSMVPRSEPFAQIIDELASSFDFLIFDLPAVLATADALDLGRLADGYVLVVRQRTSSGPEVRAALRMMTSVPCVGTMLNAARSKVPRWLRSSRETWAFDDRP